MIGCSLISLVENREMNPIWVNLVVKILLPFGSRWVRKQESAVLRDGRPLSEWETSWAIEVGVENPEKVRVLPIAHVPTPGSRLLRLLSSNTRFVANSPTGMAVNYGIFLDATHATNPSLLVHELAHVAQFEKLGGIEPFLKEYLIQCVTDGYWDSLMEQEARDAASSYTRPPGG